MIISIGALAGLTLESDVVTKDVEILISAATLISGLFAAIKRWTSKIQPLAISAAAAAAHPQTVANNTPLIFPSADATKPLSTKDDTK